MTDEDGHRIEAAVQFGFEWTNDDADEYTCTESQLIAFAKACERKGLAEAHGLANRDAVAKRISEIDAELAPILATEEERFMTARGYVRGTDEPGKRWVRHEGSETPTQISDCEVCGGDCAAANPPVMNCPLKDTDHV